jgi:hypothetical protein
MDTDDFSLRYGEHAERVCLAKIVLRRERKLRQIFERSDVARRDTQCFTLGAVR